MSPIYWVLMVVTAILVFARVVAKAARDGGASAREAARVGQQASLGCLGALMGIAFYGLLAAVGIGLVWAFITWLLGRL